MLSLSKKTDYALIALAYIAARPGSTVCAREIAAAHGLPPSLLMNILKELHQHEIVRSLRGTKGGYRLGIDPSRITLHDLIVALEGPVKMVECVSEGGCSDDPVECRMSSTCAVQAPLQALHHRLVRFLEGVKLSDIIAAPEGPSVPRVFSSHPRP